MVCGMRACMCVCAYVCLSQTGQAFAYLPAFVSLRREGWLPTEQSAPCPTQATTPSSACVSCTWRLGCTTSPSLSQTRGTRRCPTRPSSKSRCARATTTATAPPWAQWRQPGWARVPSWPSLSASSCCSVSAAGGSRGRWGGRHPTHQSLPQAGSRLEAW